jgi:hypothetical protein
MTEKEQIVKEIMTFPISYGLYRDAVDDGNWNNQKLMFTEIGILKDFLRDIKTFERNKKLINGQ